MRDRRSPSQRRRAGEAPAPRSQCPQCPPFRPRAVVARSCAARCCVGVWVAGEERWRAVADVETHCAAALRSRVVECSARWHVGVACSARWHVGVACSARWRVGAASTQHAAAPISHAVASTRRSARRAGRGRRAGTELGSGSSRSPASARATKSACWRLRLRSTPRCCTPWRDVAPRAPPPSGSPHLKAGETRRRLLPRWALHVMERKSGHREAVSGLHRRIRSRRWSEKRLRCPQEDCCNTRGSSAQRECRICSCRCTGHRHNRMRAETGQRRRT